MVTFIADKNRKLSKLALYNCNDLSYGALMKLLRGKEVKVNGKRVNLDVDLSVGDKVEIYYNPTPIDKYNALYSDENVIVINKKSGYSSEDVYADILSKNPTAKFIHRLDRNTSGIMIFALNDIAETELLAGFKNRTFEKLYRAQVYGKMEKKSDILTAYLFKDAVKSTVTITDNKVKGSTLIKTGYKVIETGEDTTELEVTLFTGKTHQIRAHLAHIGHFIVGDGKYGNNAFNKLKKAKSQRLCAYKLTLNFADNSPLNYLDKRTFTCQVQY